MSNIEDEALPISALQHYVFCPRQCALIHLEQEWSENVLTAKGRLEHNRTDSGYREFRRGRKQIASLCVNSEKYHLYGQLDVLELEEIDPDGKDNLQSFHLKGTWRIYPVEFKHGQPKKNDCDRIQLCAQVLCLEEMLSVEISRSSLYYRRIRRREDVEIDQNLRIKTIQAIEDLHTLFKKKVTPPPVYDKRCQSCSLKDICYPKKLSRSNRYQQILFTAQEAE